MTKSGISVKQEIQSYFNQIRQEETVRWFKLIIENEQFELKDTQNVSKIEDDMNSLADHVKDGKPAYFIFRLDSKNQFGNEWLLIWFVPDNAKPKEKLIYSSTVESVKKDLGATYFAGDYHCSLASELQYKNFDWEHKSEKIKNREVSMSNSEKIKMEEKNESSSFEVTTSNVRGVTFPMSDETKQKLGELKDGKIEILVVKIEKEIVQVECAGKCDIESVSTKIDPSAPRFTFWVYNHNFEEKDLSTVYFIYTCPTNSKVKERTVYSSSKNSLLSFVQGLGINVEANLETSDVSDLTSSFLHEYFHPKKVVEQIVKKPTRPGRPQTKK